MLQVLTRFGERTVWHDAQSVGIIYHIEYGDLDTWLISFPKYIYTHTTLAT